MTGYDRLSSETRRRVLGRVKEMQQMLDALETVEKQLTDDTQNSGKPDRSKELAILASLVESSICGRAVMLRHMLGTVPGLWRIIDRLIAAAHSGPSPATNPANRRDIHTNLTALNDILQTKDDQ